MAFDFGTLFNYGIYAVGGIVSILTIRGMYLKSQEKNREVLNIKIAEKADQVMAHFDEKIKTMDSKFTIVDTKMLKDEEDIKDVENDMKTMVQEFKAICEKLQRHEYVLDDVLPDFKSLQKEFQNFKAKVSNHIANTHDDETLVNSKNIQRNYDNDSENK